MKTAKNLCFRVKLGGLAALNPWRPGKTPVCAKSWNSRYLQEGGFQSSELAALCGVSHAASLTFLKNKLPLALSLSALFWIGGLTSQCVELRICINVILGL